MTVLQSISTFIDNITVTDKQEDNIKQSVSNIDGHLTNDENDLHINHTFTNGSYERDTIIRPLDDIDMFAVLNLEDWRDENGNYPSPQSVLTKFKNYLNGLHDYKGKVSQSRPCVSIELSNKTFDVLPSFRQELGGYLIPSHDLKGWTYTFPEKLTADLDEVHKKRNYKVKPTIKAVKQWNRLKGKIIPSFHIEEVAIGIFSVNSFTNYEESIRLWFNQAEYYLQASRFDSYDDYSSSLKKVKAVKDKLNDAKKLYDDGKEAEATAVWKEVFESEFPSAEAEEAKGYGKALSEGSLKMSPTGGISTTIGVTIPASKGFYEGE